MSRYIGPKTKINRKFGKLVFKSNKAFERKPYLPGIHGKRLRRKQSDYSIGLNEKQFLRYTYGLTEKQFKLIFNKAKQKIGITGSILLEMLERRLDNIIYLIGFASSRPSARQLVGHGHITINKIKNNISSYLCQIGDVIELKNKTSSNNIVAKNLDVNQYKKIPDWIKVDKKLKKATIERFPLRTEISVEVNEQIITEFYSR